MRISSVISFDSSISMLNISKNRQHKNLAPP
jgi:hypothetical protein